MAKMNGNVKWVAALIGLLLAVGGWIWNAAVVCEQVKNNDKEDARVHPIAEQNHEDIVRLQADVTYIKKGVDEIKQELKTR